ncbi:right-handed parallel beta-helix repeat-containing protein [Acinetobacter sichuanensis]|uniref:right-handed parallel beta-helix repeat-containing protein n=1 Tax=Acinetobacter sichuanensis TaxID=2136183 RepID=UPI00280D4F51|nr:right-handed parallel beta-helix repeat-containing protein [Acinetobacter sichuanensis]MDQ9022744.1 right-handed parallel beta-helix repeat-containing protein [Acinetobacter sichuanensis]
MNLQNLIFVISFSCFTLPVSAFSFVEGKDITEQLNQAIKELYVGEVLEIPAGRYKVDANKSIVLKSNISINLSPQTYLEIIPNNSQSYKLFKIHNLKNVNINGGNLIGDKYTHEGKSGEWGMGVEIRDSQNISISNMNINQMWGDAIYIGSNGKNLNKNIILKNIAMNDNQRQGLSVISVENLYASNLSIYNTSGKSPMSGIDIEPNSPSNILKNINFNNIKTGNNKGAGFLISLNQYKKSNNEISIYLSNFSDEGSKMGLRISNADPSVKGLININKIQLKNNKVSNYCIRKWSNNKIKVSIQGLIHDMPYTNKKEWCSPYENSLYLNISK